MSCNIRDIRDTDARIIEVAIRYGILRKKPLQEHLWKHTMYPECVSENPKPIKLLPVGFEIREFDYIKENGDVMSRVEGLAWHFVPIELRYEWNDPHKLI